MEVQTPLTVAVSLPPAEESALIVSRICGTGVPPQIGVARPHPTCFDAHAKG